MWSSAFLRNAQLSQKTRSKKPSGNRFLASLADSDLALLRPHLQPVDLKFRQRLEPARKQIHSAYFLDFGLASVIANGGHDRQAEALIIGNEGFTGISLILGVDRSPNETVMQAAGGGLSISAENLRNASEQSTVLRLRLLSFAHVTLIQLSQTALANAQGKIEERLSRWLLMAHDRVVDDAILLTHEFLALMLGVRRAGVTIALQELEASALVSTSRGVVNILDRTGLEIRANGFYGVPEKEYDRLLN